MKNRAESPMPEALIPFDMGFWGLLVCGCKVIRLSVFPGDYICLTLWRCLDVRVIPYGTNRGPGGYINEQRTGSGIVE